MHIVHRTPRLSVTHQAVNTLDADLLVLPVFEADDFADLPGLDRAAGGEITAAQIRRELRGSLYESFQTTLTDPEWKTRRLLLVGAGPRAAFSDERLRRLATAAGLVARQRRLERLARVTRPGLGADPARMVQLLAEGTTLANYEGASLKRESDVSWLSAVELQIPEAKGLSEAVTRGVTMGESSNVARSFANEPGNRLT